jgi:hypothetical protein
MRLREELKAKLKSMYSWVETKLNSEVERQSRDMLIQLYRDKILTKDYNNLVEGNEVDKTAL